VPSGGRTIAIKASGGDMVNNLKETTLGGWLLYVLREADSALSLEESLHSIMDSMKTYFPSQSVAVVLIDDDTKEVRIKISRQISYSFVKKFKRAAPGPHVERMILEHKPFRVHRDDASPDLYGEVKLEHDFQQAVLVPIIKSHRGVGYVFCDRANAAPFTDADLLHLQVIGFLIGNLMTKFELMMERKQLSPTDDATGALKYNVFMEAFVTELHRSIVHGYPVAAALLQTVAFRKYLDTYGIDRAHAILADITRVIRARSRDMDILARYGADQFILCLSGATVDEARATLETIRSEAHRNVGAGEHIPVELTVGALVLETEKQKRRPLQDLLGLLGQALMDAASEEHGGMKVSSLR
jgi:diguanylate cyclase (GGDEF)-like protein